MTDPQNPHYAPYIVETGTVINKRDMYRLLADLGRVQYLDIVDGQVQRQGEAYVMEVYKDPYSATMIVNRTIYLNIYSFDYINLDTQTQLLDQEFSPRVTFDLVRDHRILRLVPLSDPLSDPFESIADTRALKEAVADAISAGWDPTISDDDDADH